MIKGNEMMHMAKGGYNNMYDVNSIEESIRNLRKKFLEIREMEYVKSVREGSTGVGATFEALLGKSEDSLEIPDFGGVEIKARRSYSKSPVGLFNAVPTGSTFYEVKRIRDQYGYPDANDNNLKRFQAKIGADEIVKVWLFYSFSLKVDRKKERLVLLVYDWNKVLIDDTTYWDFDILKEKLIRKLNVLAVVQAWTNRINGEEYFKYYKMNVYILRDFESFLDALESGDVKVLFKTGNYYDEARYGMVRSHGVGFVIDAERLDRVFEYYR